VKPAFQRPNRHPLEKIMDESTADLERRARRRVKRKLGFYWHLMIYILVNAGLIAINLPGNNSRWGHGDFFWSGFPLIGWGIGLAIHGIVTFISLQGEGLKEGMLAREIETLKRREGR
jgi:hypothetical protein